MAKDKEKSINPAAAARKAEKAKALKKGKAAIAQQRNDRLAKQNPHRIQTQIDDLKALEANHSINAREKKQLDELERELARVIKAKEAAGEKYVPRTQQQRTGDDSSKSVLGKRSRGDHRANNRRQFSPESSDTDLDVADVPMPRDTPPPVLRRRREDAQMKDGTSRPTHELPDKPEVASGPSQAVYESKPMLRDLRKEAAAFVPAAVRRRVAEGLGAGSSGAGKMESRDEVGGIRGAAIVEAASSQRDNEEDDVRRLQEEEERWRREMKQVTIEEVEDEDA